MRIEALEFQEGGAIPTRYTCEGDDTAPALRFVGVPAEAKSLALIVDDPDAPDPRAPQRTWVHWVAYNLPPEATGVAEGGKLPERAQAGHNDWGRSGYGGPCPPIGRHRYFFKLYALDRMLDGLKSPTKAQLEKAMHGHVVAQAQLIGTYEKKH